MKNSESIIRISGLVFPVYYEDLHCRKAEGARQRINELVAYVKTQDAQITEYDDKLVRKYIDQIQIYEDKFVVCFKVKMKII